MSANINPWLFVGGGAWYRFFGAGARLYQDAVVPLLQQQPGFQHTSLLAKHTS